MPQPPRPPVPPLAGLAFGVLITSTAAILIRLAQASAPSLLIAAGRMGVASLILLAPAVLRHRRAWARLTRPQLIEALLAGALLAVHFATWITSLELTSVASSVVLVSTAPLFVALLSRPVLREAVPRPVWLGVALATAGGVAVAVLDACAGAGAGCMAGSLLPSGEAALRGDALALIGGAAAAGYFLIGRRLRAQLPLLVYITATYSAAAVLLAVTALAAGLRPLGLPAQAWLIIALLALGPQVLGHSSLNWALRYVPAAVVSLALLGEPIGSTLLAALLFREVPGPAALLAMALILAGIALAARAPAPSSGGV